MKNKNLSHLEANPDFGSRRTQQTFLKVLCIKLNINTLQNYIVRHQYACELSRCQIFHHCQIYSIATLYGLDSLLWIGSCIMFSFLQLEYNSTPVAVRRYFCSLQLLTQKYTLTINTYNIPSALKPPNTVSVFQMCVRRVTGYWRQP